MQIEPKSVTKVLQSLFQVFSSEYRQTVLQAAAAQLGRSCGPGPIEALQNILLLTMCSAWQRALIDDEAFRNEQHPLLRADSGGDLAPA